MKFNIWLDSTQSITKNFKEIQSKGGALSKFFLPTYDCTWIAPFPLPKRAYVSVKALSLGTEISDFKGGSGTSQQDLNLMTYSCFNCFGGLTFNLNVSSEDVMTPEEAEDTWGHVANEDIQGPLTAPFNEPAPKPDKLLPIGVAEVWKSVSQNTTGFNFPNTNPPTTVAKSIFAATPLLSLIRMQKVRQLVSFNNQSQLRLILTAPQKFQNQDDGASPTNIVSQVGKTKFFNLDIPHCSYPLFTEVFGLESSTYLPFDFCFKVCLEIEPLNLEIERPLKTTKWLWIDSRRTLREGRLAILAKDQQTPNYQGYITSPISELYRRPTFDLFYRFPYQLEGLYKVRVACFNLAVEVKGMGEDQIRFNSCYEANPMFNSLFVNSNFSSAYIANDSNDDPDAQALTSDFTIPIQPLTTKGFYNLTSIGKVGVADFMGNPTKYLTSKVVNGSGGAPPYDQNEVFAGQLSAVPNVPQVQLEGLPKVFNINPSQNQLHIVLTTNNFLQMENNSADVYENWRIPYMWVSNYMPSTAHPTPEDPRDSFFLPLDLPYTACIELEPC